MDEAYILVSSVIIDRILAASDLKCTGYGSFTAAAWMMIGGAGNPDGDVAWAVDRRLDYEGHWLRGKGRTGEVCEYRMGIHRTYPYKMKEEWEKTTGKNIVSQSTPDGCKDIFRYEDEWPCTQNSRAADDEFLLRRLAIDNVQLCDSFKSSPNPKMWCGSQGC